MTLKEIGERLHIIKAENEAKKDAEIAKGQFPDKRSDYVRELFEMVVYLLHRVEEADDVIQCIMHQPQQCRIFDGRWETCSACQYLEMYK